MTAPPSSPAQPKILTPAMVAALVALAVLAVVTIVVVATANPDDDTSSSAHGSTSSSSVSPSSAVSSSAAPSSTAPSSAASSTPSTAPSPQAVTDVDLGVRYTYTDDDSYTDYWGGPADISAGIVDLKSTVTYPACTYAAGSDVLYAFLTSEENDLAQAAKIAAVDLGKSVWAGTGEASITEPTDPVEQTTDHGVTGYISELNSTRAGNAPDECGTTTAHIVAFAFDNADGDTVVMVSSSRVDGDTLKPHEEFITDVVLTFLSLELV